MAHCCRQAKRSPVMRVVNVLVVGLFAFQALIPTGTMPAAWSSGWLLQICPDGLTPAAMAVFHPGHAEPEAHNHHTAHQNAPAPDNAQQFAMLDCDFAGLVFAPCTTPVDDKTSDTIQHTVFGQPRSVSLAPPVSLLPPARAPPQQFFS